MDASSTYQDSLPVSSDTLLKTLTRWGVDFTLHDHIPLRSVADSKSIEDMFIVDGEAGIFLKNLYLRDKKKRNYLVTVQQDREIDLKVLGAKLGVGNLSFGSADRLMQNLGIRPGAVSPLAMVTGAKQDVRFFMDRAVLDADRAYMHPLVNDRTIGLPTDALNKVFEQMDVTVEWLDLD